MQTTHSFFVPAAPVTVWELLWDIPVIAGCIPGCQGVRATGDPNRYEAKVVERVGPFQVQFELDVNVVESQPPERLRAAVSGRDRRLASALNVELELTVLPAAGDGGGTEEGGCQVTVVSTTRMQGKLATLGHALVRRKVEENMQAFAEALQARLSQDGE